MSLFKERLEMALRGAKNPDKILEARWNARKKEMGTLDPAIEAEAERRLLICLECPFNSVNAKTSSEYKELLAKGTGNPNPPEFTTERPETFCTWCLCPVDGKTLSMTSNCGLEHYNYQYQQQEPLKWTAFPG